MGIFTLLGLSAYFLVYTVVGIRLVRMAHRTREAPEFLIGAAFLTGGTIGYVLVAASALTQVSSPGWSRALYYIGMPFISIGAVCVYSFWQRLYHPTEVWAKCLVGVAAAVLAGALFGQWWTTEVGSFANDSWFYFALLGAQLLGYVLNFFANTHFHVLLRRRLALGLADPIVANRVLLWAFASGLTAAQYAYAVWVTWMTPVGQPPIADPGAMSVFGMIGAAAVVLAFFPPAAYKRFVCDRAAPGSSADTSG